MEDRIYELEMKVAFQEDTLNQLDAVIFEQQTKIDLLTKQLQYLLENARQTDSSDKSTSSLEDDIPPHY